ncbi:MAG: hypothetical protein ACJAW3_000194 [Lentimonas sp.]
MICKDHFGDENMADQFILGVDVKPTQTTAYSAVIKPDQQRLDIFLVSL